MTRLPFTALVGQDRLKTALLVAAVDPSVGSVLICGEKGTAKSTAARALAELLPPSSGQDLAWEAFDRLPVGGRTPIAHALMLTLNTVRRERLREKEQAVLVVLLTDGKANVALPGTDGAPWQQTVSAARLLADEAIAALALDTEQDFVKLGRARELAEAMQAEYRSLDSLDAETLTFHIGRVRGDTSMRSGVGR